MQAFKVNVVCSVCAFPHALKVYFYIKKAHLRYICIDIQIGCRNKEVFHLKQKYF